MTRSELAALLAAHDAETAEEIAKAERMDAESAARRQAFERVRILGFLAIGAGAAVAWAFVPFRDVAVYGTLAALLWAMGTFLEQPHHWPIAERLRDARARDRVRYEDELLTRAALRKLALEDA